MRKFLCIADNEKFTIEATDLADAQAKAAIYNGSVIKTIVDKPKSDTSSQRLLDFVCKHDRLLYLKARWQDEREYEDFSEYKKIIIDIFEAEGFKVYKVTSSFEITLVKEGTEFCVKINLGSVKIKSRSLTSTPKPIQVAPKQAPKPTGKVIPLGVLARQFIREGWTNEEVLAKLKSAFPTAKTSINCVRWYRNQMKKQAA